MKPDQLSPLQNEKAAKNYEMNKAEMDEYYKISE
jgi:hypothetical protein